MAGQADAVAMDPNTKLCQDSPLQDDPHILGFKVRGLCEL